MGFTVRNTPIGLTAIAVGLISSIGGFLFGYDTGQISGITNMVDFLRRFGTVTLEGDTLAVAKACSYNAAFKGQDVTDHVLKCQQLNSWLDGLIVSFMSIGTMFGALAGSYLADFLGRRRAMQWEVLMFLIGVAIQISAINKWYQFAIGRLVTGLGIGALSCAVPIYQSETVPRQLRGTLVATYQWAITAGILVAYAIDIATRNIGTGSWGDVYGRASTGLYDPPHVVSEASQWRVPVGLGMFFAALLAGGIQLCPESPRWLAMHGRYEEAREAVARVRGKTVAQKDPYVEAEYYEILQAAEAEAQHSVTWLDVFRPQNKTLYRTILGMVLQMGQQLTGANYFFYYGTQIMKPVGITDPFVTQIIFGAVNFVCTALGLWMLEAIGRRLPLIFGGLWCSAWLLVFATAGVAANKPDPDTGIKKLGSPQLSSGIGKLMICSGCFFILGYASTWAPGIWLFTGEVFDSRTRARQAALATLSNWIWNFLLALFTTPITADIGFAYGYIFAGANLFNAFVAFFYVYETKDLNLEQVNAMYCDPNCKAWQSRSWVPAGMSSRDDIQGEIHKQSEAANVAGALVDDEMHAGKPPASGGGGEWHDGASDSSPNEKPGEAEGIAAKLPPGTKLATQSAA